MHSVQEVAFSTCVLEKCYDKDNANPFMFSRYFPFNPNAANLLHSATVPLFVNDIHISIISMPLIFDYSLFWLRKCL